MDVDAIISVVALALVALIGANTWLLLVARDKVGHADKRVEALALRLARLLEWVDSNGSGAGKRSK